MKFISLLPKPQAYSSVRWIESQTIPGVRFAIRRISLQQRIDLTQRIKELTLKEEYLRAGGTGDQLEASVLDLMVQKAFLDWGLIGVEGLTIDGLSPSAELLSDKGPEVLANEVIATLRAESGLSDEERKNS